jgi:hypothetical protein
LLPTVARFNSDPDFSFAAQQILFDYFYGSDMIPQLRWPSLLSGM